MDEIRKIVRYYPKIEIMQNERVNLIWKLILNESDKESKVVGFHVLGKMTNNVFNIPL